AVAHIEKEQIAEVAAACDPAHYNSVAAYVLGAQFAAVMCALQVAEKIEQAVLPLRMQSSLHSERKDSLLDFLGNLKRTHYCGELRAKDVGRDAIVMGALQ